jgi:hypothetical protein
MNDSKARRRQFQFGLREMLLVFSLLALSFGLLRKAYLLYNPRTDNNAYVAWLAVGLSVLGGTLGATVERICNPSRSGIAWMLVSVILALLLTAVITKKLALGWYS